MAEKSGQHTPSFTRLIRGASDPGAPEHKESFGSKISLHREGKEKDEKRRKPILLPFGKGEAGDALFSIGYREWAFLFGAILLLFGGMGLVRYFGPKEGPLS